MLMSEPPRREICQDTDKARQGKAISEGHGWFRKITTELPGIHKLLHKKANN